MLGKAPAGSAGAANKSGWMTKEIFSSYLQHFVTFTRCSLQYPCLLLLDNHVSHISLDNIKFTKANGIVLLPLPPHCSHKLQPLDRSVFGPLEAAANNVASNWMISNPGKCMKITTILELVTMVYNQVFTVKNIQGGFRVSGICPFNSTIFTQQDFAPYSYVTYSSTSDMNSKYTMQIHNLRAEDLDITSTTVSSSSNYILPNNVRPILKSSSQSEEKRTTRSRGRTAILTDTPEMLNMEGQKEIKTKKEC